MTITTSQNAQDIRPLASTWLSRSRQEEFGLSANVEDVLDDLATWLSTVEGTLLLAWDRSDLAGFMAVFACPSYLSAQQKIALEKYWFSKEGKVGLHLYDKAMQWAAQHGCSHMIVSASNLAGPNYDKICRFCEHKGMRLFETAYIAKVE